VQYDLHIDDCEDELLKLKQLATDRDPTPPPVKRSRK
jgi:hypothetical protein